MNAAGGRSGGRDSGRWRQIEAICSAALAREVQERADFVERACGGDQELLEQVDAMLAGASRADRFLETPVGPLARERQTGAAGAGVLGAQADSIQGAPLSPGTRLGPYEVQSVIGVGGMGAVYKAYDTRLGRTVAIKVLLSSPASNPAVRLRFEREAHAASVLNHPHICAVHDVGREGDTDFLVMEYLDGQTLAAQLEKGALPLKQAITVATEIADALSAAHRHGVVHRDLKPGNVMLTKSGAKVLDFGLAKVTGDGGASAVPQVAAGPTSPAPLTAQGMILGTLRYMAPEQVEGKAADARADLWALGVILYEMVTGRPAFEGQSQASLIAGIIEREPIPITAFQPLTPPALEWLVQRCLAKAADDRPDTAHDVANDLRWLRETSGLGAVMGVPQRRRERLRTALLVATVPLAALIGAGVMWLGRPPAPQASLAYLDLNIRPADELYSAGFDPSFVATSGGSRTALTWTPDGQALVFVGRRAGVQQLYVRRLDAVEARLLPGTEDAQAPAVSPDGQWVAFWSGGVVKKVPLGGGLVVDLAPDIEYPPWGLIWDAHGGLFVGRYSDGIWAIPADGKPTPVTKVADAEVGHTLPALLPGGRVLLYTVRKRRWTWGDEEVIAQRLPSGERTLLLTDAADARYVPTTGHLLFMRRGVLYAVRFDPQRLQRLGPETPVRDGVAQALSAGNHRDATGAGQFAVSSTGTLAWIPGPVVGYPQGRLVKVDRHGQVTALPLPTRSYGMVVRLSPDRRRLALLIRTLAENGLWIYDLVRPSPLLRLTTDGEASWFVWEPGGRELAFTWLKNGRRSLATQLADGTAPPRILMPGVIQPSSTTPDGRIAAIGPGDDDILLVTVENGTARVEPLIQTPYTDRWPEFSPDGRWLLYGSDATGRPEIYVRPYPEHGREFPVSAAGGSDPAWHPSGREIFFVSPLDPAGKRRMMAVAFTPGSPQPVGRPQELFSFDPRDLHLACFPIRCYDVAADGQRFYAAQGVVPPLPAVVTRISLTQNWFEELATKVRSDK